MKDECCIIVIGAGMLQATKNSKSDFSSPFARGLLQHSPWAFFIGVIE